MKYGCIGEKLSHSFSREIHSLLADYPYELYEVAREDLDTFIKVADFTAINVTIPYKEMVLCHLDEIDEHAKLIGAVNTVVKRNGKLYGYNTDFFGMSKLLEHAGICPRGKKALILGSGGTAKTARAVLEYLGARMIITVGRRAKDGVIDYETALNIHTDAEIIINTTPVGMYPTVDACPIDIGRFNSLEGVIDAIYNPLRTRLILDAKKRGIAAEGGLYMLVAQAVRASEIFLGTTYPEDTVEKVYQKILREKENIVLIGMPASGKSTVGGIISKRLSRELLDTDELIKVECGCEIQEIFERFSEEHFRNIESRIVNNCSLFNNKILATGGGVVLNRSNIDHLSQNGKIYFIDRPLHLLIPTEDRPLASTKDAIEKRFIERYELYLSLCDKRIVADKGATAVAEEIISDFYN